ncbi:MAG: archaeal flagellin N-terminal-like domain protein [Halonotius sp. J07HN6]|nr:MAG: archaeal flagellin N-terminal-like domain protein [Halonotius sp. J07HN6]
MLKTDHRGQVGIGTLIVFIAMVLVAAIAAGVLINTAGLLQAQAQQTGQETSAEVSDLLQVGKVVGSDTPAVDQQIEVLNASVKLAAGASPINVSRASYTIQAGGQSTVVNGNNYTNDAITLYQIQGLDDGTTILSDQQDLMAVQFNLTRIDGVEPLDESERITIITRSPAGGSSYKQVMAPRSIENGEAYIL